MKGIFISFEGLDFSGKSEQCRRLLGRFEEAGYRNIEFLREPGGVEIAEKIRKVVLDARNSRMNERTELLLYSAARAQIVTEKILPALELGKIVIADRYADSTTVYQGIGRGLDLEFVKAVNAFATRSLMPNLTFLLDISWAVAVERRMKNKLSQDRLESEGEEFHHRVRQAYIKLAKAEANRFITIDGSQSPDAIEEEIVRHLKRRFTLDI